MSSSPLELPILISQLPHVAKLQNAEQSKPEIQRSLFAPLIAEHLRRDSKRVGKVDGQEAPNAVHREKDHPEDGSRQEQQAAGERKKQDEDTKGSESSPWSGNIVNMKV